MASRNSQLKSTDPAGEAVAQRRNRVDLFRLACDRVEELLADCTPRSGRHLIMQDLQDIKGLGRTPVHHAVNCLGPNVPGHPNPINCSTWSACCARGVTR